MARLTWSHAYSIGVGFINKQHKHLFDLINQFEDCIAKDAPYDELSGLLTELVFYCEQHFTDEEELLRACGFPADLQEKHKQTHSRLCEDIFKINEDLARGEAAAKEKLRAFLSEWISGHVLKDDKAMAPYVKEFADFVPTGARAKSSVR